MKGKEGITKKRERKSLNNILKTKERREEKTIVKFKN